jgi:hypothetical protein
LQKIFQPSKVYRKIFKIKNYKIYIALVEGKLEKEHDFIMIYMKKIYENGNYRIEYSSDSGEPTLSEFYLWKHLYDERSEKYYSLVFVRIYTGMTHQSSYEINWTSIDKCFSLWCIQYPPHANILNYLRGVIVYTIQ